MIIVSATYGIINFISCGLTLKIKEMIIYQSSSRQRAGRDEEWKEMAIRNTSEEQFQQEFECEFLGSVNTLISP